MKGALGQATVAHARLDPETSMQPDNRQQPAADHHHLAFSMHCGERLLRGAKHLPHREDRHNVALLPNGNHETFDDGKRQRKLDEERCSLRLRFELNFNASAKLLHVFADDIHTDAAPGDVRDFVRGGEAGLEDEEEHFVVRKLRVLLDEAVLASLGEDFLTIQTTTVVSDHNDDLTRLVVGCQFRECSAVGSLPQRNARSSGDSMP